MNHKSEKQSVHRVKLFYAHEWAEREEVMKKLILVSMVLFLTLAAYGGRASGSTAEERGISLGIIIDTSPSSQKTWNMFQAAILEMTYQLRRGDKVTIYTAHPGKPRLRVIRVISSEGKLNPSDIVMETMSFSRELLSGTNLSRAVELVFADFYREANEYQHCLVILSNGKINSYKVAQIKKLVVNFKNNSWPVRLICEPAQASRSLLVAANNQQLDLRMLDKPQLTEWITAARSLIANKVPPTNDTPTHTEKVIEDTKPVQDSNDHKTKEADVEPIKVEVINFPGLQTGDSNDDTVIEAGDGEVIEAEHGKQTDLPKDKTSPKVGKWWLWLIILSGTVVIAGSWYCLKKRIFANVFSEQFGDQIDGQEDLPQRLISFVGQQRQDMGDIATLGEIIIGRAAGSSVYIDNDNVEERHVRIFKSGRQIKVQNLASSPITVDGAQLNRKKKTDLIFPSEIELAGGVVISLVAEDVNLV